VDDAGQHHQGQDKMYGVPVHPGIGQEEDLSLPVVDVLIALGER